MDLIDDQFVKKSNNFSLGKINLLILLAWEFGDHIQVIQLT